MDAERDRLLSLVARLWRWVDSCSVVSSEDARAFDDDQAEAKATVGAPERRPSEPEPDQERDLPF